MFPFFNQVNLNDLDIEWPFKWLQDNFVICIILSVWWGELLMNYISFFMLCFLYPWWRSDYCYVYIYNQVWLSLLQYQTRGGGDNSRVLENSESPVGFIVQMFVSEQQCIFYTFHSVITSQSSTAIPFAPEPHSFFLKETKQIGRNIPAIHRSRHMSRTQGPMGTLTLKFLLSLPLVLGLALTHF